MSSCSSTPAKRQFRFRCIAVAFGCLAAYFVTFYAIPRPSTGLIPLILAAISGAFYFAFFVTVGVLAFGLRDEFQRVLLTRAFLWATIITMGITMIWGFVELGSHDTVPHLPVLILPAVLVAFTAAAKLFFFRQHKSPVD